MMAGDLYAVGSQKFVAIASRRGVQSRTNTAEAVDVRARFFRGDAEKGISE